MLLINQRDTCTNRLGSLKVGIRHFLTPLFSSSTDCQTAAANLADRSHLQIRAANLEDLTGIAEILADSFHSQQGMFGWAYPLLRLGIYEDLRTRMRSASAHHICLVAAAGDKLAGTVEMGLRSIEHRASDGKANPKMGRSPYPYLSNLAVHPTQRRQGVAEQLLLSCERAAVTWGVQDLYLHVLENNHQARQLYFKVGYRLHQVDASWSAWLLKKPRQLLLHKHLSHANHLPCDPG